MNDIYKYTQANISIGTKQGEYLDVVIINHLNFATALTIHL